MLSSLRADFKDFFSSVKEDSSFAMKDTLDDAVQVLEKLDDTVSAGLGRKKKARISEAEAEAIHRMGLVTVYTLPFKFDDEKEDNLESATHKEQYLSLEDQDWEQYIETFDIKEKTEEIAALLNEHDCLRATFSELVPLEVSYQDFWKRHFYRCDPARIERAWAARGALDSEARRGVLHKIIHQPVVKALSNPFQAALVALKGKGTTESQKGLEYTLQELEGLQYAISTSNQRIISLRGSLDDTKRRLAESERDAAELQAELNKTKTELQDKNYYVAELQQKIKSLGHSVSMGGGDVVAKASILDEAESKVLPGEQTHPLVEDVLSSPIKADKPVIHVEESPTSTLSAERSTMFKFAASRIFGTSHSEPGLEQAEECDAGSIESGWGDEDVYEDE